MNQLHKPTAKVMKVCKKLILVKVKSNKYDTAGTIGYCDNPDNLKLGDVILDFPPIKGVTNMTVLDKETGERRIMTTKDGEPLSFLVFA